jgi:hypothetical protein
LPAEIGAHATRGFVLLRGVCGNGGQGRKSQSQAGCITAQPCSTPLRRRHGMTPSIAPPSRRGWSVGAAAMPRQTKCEGGCTACRESARVNNERDQKELLQVSNEETEKPQAQAMAIRAAKKTAKKSARKAPVKKGVRKTAAKKTGAKRKVAAKGTRKTAAKRTGAKRKVVAKSTRKTAAKKAVAKRKVGASKAAAKKTVRKTTARKRKAPAAPAPEMPTESSGDTMN